MSNQIIVNKNKIGKKDWLLLEYEIPDIYFKDISRCPKTEKYSIRLKGIDEEYLKTLINFYEDLINNPEKYEKNKKKEIEILKTNTRVIKRKSPKKNIIEI